MIETTHAHPSATVAAAATVAVLVQLPSAIQAAVQPTTSPYAHQSFASPRRRVQGVSGSRHSHDTLEAAAMSLIDCLVQNLARPLPSPRQLLAHTTLLSQDLHPTRVDLHPNPAQRLLWKAVTGYHSWNVGSPPSRCEHAGAAPAGTAVQPSPVHLELPAATTARMRSTSAWLLFSALASPAHTPSLPPTSPSGCRSSLQERPLWKTLSFSSCRRRSSHHRSISNGVAADNSLLRRVALRRARPQPAASVPPHSLCVLSVLDRIAHQHQRQRQHQHVCVPSASASSAPP